MVLLALASVVAVALSNLNGLAIGDDGVGYRAIADSLLAGNGFGYFLERPVTIWPPLWPALMAVVAKVTPFGPPGATVVLNCITVVLATVVGHRLLRRLVGSDLLVFLGTAVIALGSSTIGFGHLLMTDFAFAVVVMAWLLCLMNFRDTGKLLVAPRRVRVGVGRLRPALRRHRPDRHRWPVAPPGPGPLVRCPPAQRGRLRPGRHHLPAGLDGPEPLRRRHPHR